MGLSSTSAMKFLIFSCLIFFGAAIGVDQSPSYMREVLSREKRGSCHSCGCSVFLRTKTHQMCQAVCKNVDNWNVWDWTGGRCSMMSGGHTLSQRRGSHAGQMDIGLY